MTQEEKELLLKDLCARLPYGVKIATRQYNYCDILTPKGIVGDKCYFNDNPRYDGDCSIDEFKPYLRPMWSLVGKELDECRATCKYRQVGQSVLDCATSETIDYLNAHQFDYRGLIEKGLALEAPIDMYKAE